MGLLVEVSSGMDVSARGVRGERLRRFPPASLDPTWSVERPEDDAAERRRPQVAGVGGGRLSLLLR
jgi:hypothetical protein